MRLLATLILGLALTVSAACSNERFVPPTVTATSESVSQTSGPTDSAAPGVPSSSQAFLLEITSPQNESVINMPSVTVRGKSTADAVVSVNGQLAEVGTDGSFESFVALDPGPNTIEIVANDFHGGQNSKLLTVIYVP